MKKCIASLLIMFLLLGFAGCAKNDSSLVSGDKSQSVLVVASSSDSVSAGVSSLSTEQRSEDKVEFITADGSNRQFVEVGDTFVGWTITEMSICRGEKDPENTDTLTNTDVMRGVNAQLVGNVELTGSIEYDKDNPMEPSVDFIPDAESLAKIPFPLVDYTNIKDSGNPIESFININEPDIVFDMIAAEKRAGSFENSKIRVTAISMRSIWDTTFFLNFESFDVVDLGTEK